MAATSIFVRNYLKDQLETALLNPVRAFRPRYLPLLAIFASGRLLPRDC
jgi:hypothetical protein